MVTQIEQENLNAKQDLNNEYLKQNGAKSQKSVIDFFIKYNIPFMVASALASAFGFYYDLKSSIGVLGAIVVGLALGAMLEQLKQKSINGLFNKSFSDSDRLILGSLAIFTLVIALTYHYKSMITFENVTVQDVLQEQVNYERELKSRTAINISSILKTNQDLSIVLSNGYKGNDKATVATQKSNNLLISQLLEIKGESYSTRKLIEQTEKSAKENAFTLLLIFITIEIFALLGILGKKFINSSTSDSVKSLVTTMDKLIALETNVTQQVETAMISRTMNKIQAEVEKISPSPALPTVVNQQYQEQKSKIALQANIGDRAYFMGSMPKIDYSSQKATNLPILSYQNPHFSDAMREKEDLKDESLEQKITDEKTVVDLLKYNHKEQQIMFVMWENGDVKEDDKLIPKRLVKMELKEERLITHREIDELYEKLQDQGHIIFKGGWRAVNEIENIIKNKI